VWDIVWVSPLLLEANDGCNAIWQNSLRQLMAYNCVTPASQSIRRSVLDPVFQSLVVSFVLTKLDYGNATLTELPAYQYRRLQSVINAATRLIYATSTFRPCHVALTGTALVEVVRVSCLQVGSDILPVPLWFGIELPWSERPSCS